jgi:hypothetical protein
MYGAHIEESKVENVIPESNISLDESLNIDPKNVK